MSSCNSCGDGQGSPFSEGLELVKFVYNAHNGAIRNQPITNGPLKTKCQGCGKEFILETYVGLCPYCDGVHAVSPPRSNDQNNIQFAGKGFKL